MNETTDDGFDIHGSDRQAIGARLRSLRLARGLRLADITAISGISEPYLSRIESGQRWPSLPTLLTLAKAYEIDVSVLLQKSAITDLGTLHHATATWAGSEDGGSGQMTSKSFVMRYDRNSRIEQSNDPASQGLGSPEELIGMAFAGCFSMSLAARLGTAGFSPKRIVTRAEVRLETGPERVTVGGIHLVCEARVDRIMPSRFDEIASVTKQSCVIARALAAVNVTLDSHLSQSTPVSPA